MLQQIWHAKHSSTLILSRASTHSETYRRRHLIMSTKRGSAEGNGEDVVAKRGKVSLADSVDVNAVMSSEGPIVSAVILRANGECEELVMDMSPKLQLVAKELGCNVGFLGQWETLEVVLVTRTDQDNESIPLNTHTLQPPFHDAEVRGDILLMKNNEEGIPVDFTLKEYQEFQQLVIEKWEPGEALSDEEGNDEDDDEDDVDEDEDEDADEQEDDGEEDDLDEKSFFSYMLKEALEKFVEENSREPTEEEMKDIEAGVQATVQQIQEQQAADQGEDDDGEEEDTDDDEDTSDQLVQFIDQIYGRLQQKFITDNGRTPNEDEIGPLRDQAKEYGAQIISQQAEQGEDDEDDEEEGGEEDGEGGDGEAEEEEDEEEEEEDEEQGEEGEGDEDDQGEEEEEGDDEPDNDATDEIA